MNSIERQRRLTKLLAMVQTTRVALAVLRSGTSPADTVCITGQIVDADELLKDAANLLVDALRLETAGR